MLGAWLFLLTAANLAQAALAEPRAAQ
jgi:hypothetical protein